MGFPKISPEGTTTLLKFAGDVMNKIQDYLSGTNIAASDGTNKPDIGTNTRFRTGTLRVFDNDRSHSFYFDTSAVNISEDKGVKFPALVAAQDTFVFVGQPQILTNKTIDYNDNSITNWPPAEGLGFSKGGTALFNGDGIDTEFLIPHTMGVTPTLYMAIAKNAATLSSPFTVSADATNIIVTYTGTPPPSGTDNVQFIWGAGEPQDEYTVTVLGELPAEPPAGKIRIFPTTTVDANNIGYFAWTKLNNVLTEVRLF